MSSLDHLTNGRAGWNIVTSHSNSAAQAFGMDQVVPHDERYAAADEYMQIVYQYVIPLSDMLLGFSR